jgi:hypothetical protein
MKATIKTSPNRKPASSAISKIYMNEAPRDLTSQEIILFRQDILELHKYVRKRLAHVTPLQ